MNEIKFMIPENLDIEEVIRKNEDSFYKNGLMKDKLLFLIDSLISSRAKHRKQLNNKKKRFVPLSTDILQEVVHDYEKYLVFLLDLGIFQTDNSFIPGKKCRGYCLNSIYEGQKLKQLTVDNFRLKKAKKRSLEIRVAEARKAAWGYSHLTKWWDGGKLKIDLGDAFEWLDDYQLELIKIIQEGLTKRKAKRTLRIIDTVEDFKVLAGYINGRKAHYSFSGDGHRFYNPITNLKRELRNFLTYDGQLLTEVDMKNSQPFLATCLFKSSFWESSNGENLKKRSLERIDKKLYKKVKSSKVNKDIITLLKTAETHTDKASPFQKFIDLVVSGEFYEYIQKHFEPLYPKTFETRQKVKVSLLTIFYLENERAPFNQPSQTFREHFPEVYELFRLIKSIESNLLPILLQRIESYLILDVVCREIGITYPKIPLFTIHDSIISPQGNEALIEEIMAREIENWTGYKASFGQKELAPMKLAA